MTQSIRGHGGNSPGSGRQGRVRRIYPGANTGYGFYSFYHEVAPVDAEKIYVIKGGPGVGKSTFCRKIGDELVSRGYDVEYLHCSGDADSIDGIYIPALRIELVDGTAPHVIDPKNPGAVDEIIHLGDYWDEAGMRSHRDEIVRDTKEATRNFQRAYRYMKIALQLMEEREEYVRDAGALDVKGLNRAGEELIAAVFAGTDARDRVPCSRHLFASAITHRGHQNHFDTLFGSLGRRYVLTGPPGSGRTTLVRKVHDRAMALGYDVEAWHDVLDPERIEHVIIPELDVAVINGSAPHPFEPGDMDVLIDTGEFVDQERLGRYRSFLDEAEAAYEDAVNRAIFFLGEAKKVHDRLETHYVPNMDWEEIERRRREVRDEILWFAGREADQVQTASPASVKG